MPFASKEIDSVIGGKRHGVNTRNVMRNAATHLFRVHYREVAYALSN